MNKYLDFTFDPVRYPVKDVQVRRYFHFRTAP
jgi:hypothetical protein